MRMRSLRGSAELQVSDGELPLTLTSLPTLSQVQKLDTTYVVEALGYWAHTGNLWDQVFTKSTGPCRGQDAPRGKVGPPPQGNSAHMST